MPSATTTRKILIAFAIFYVTSLFTYSVFIVPRPYYIQTTDIEDDYYYNARLIYSNFLTRTVTHPGTPLYYLYSKIFIFVGDDIARTQEFLRVIYFAQAILNILALIIFIRFLPEEQNSSVKFFAVVLAVALPSFLTYQDYIGADALAIILGLPYLILVQKLITRERKNTSLFILLGIFTAFAIASKFSFLLLAVPSYLALFLSSFLWKDWGGVKTLLLLPFISLIFFASFISRIIYRLPAIVNQVVFRDNFGNASGISDFIEVLFINAKYLFLNRPAFSFSIALLAVFFALLFALYLTKLFRKKIVFYDADKIIIPQAIFFFFGITTLLINLVSAGNTPVNTAGGEELGVILRNVVLPLLLLFSLTAFATIQLAKRIGWEFSKKIYLGLFALSLLLISESVIKHVSYRNHLIKFSLERMEKTEKKLLEFVPDGASFAIWGSGSNYAFGPATFHYWGNHRYGWNSFDEELRKTFDPVGFFQFRVAGQLIGQNRLDTIDRNYALPKILQDNARLSSPYLWWRAKFPPPKETDNILTGEGIVANLKVVMFPETERELPQSDDEKLMSLLEYRLGYKFTKKIVNIEGRDWTIFTSAE